MSKLQSAAEPSMEDILASIRKMISEERLGPRPVPDQMSRTPFGEASSAKSAEPVAVEAEPQSEPEPQPEPELRPQTQLRTQAAPEKNADPAPTGQSLPSFSSLSDALKAASKPSAQHRSLDEKIADMLDKGPAPAPARSVSVDPLAVFAATRTARSGAVQSEPGSANGKADAGMPGRLPDPISTASRPGEREQSAADDKPSEPLAGIARVSQDALNGAMPGRQDPKVSDLGTVVPLTSDASSARREVRSPRQVNGPAGPADAAGAEANGAGDDRTVISIPSRGTGGPGSGQAAVAPKNGALNGATVSPFGPRPSPGSAATARAEDGSNGKSTPLADAQGPFRPSLDDIAEATRPGVAARADAGSDPSKADMSFNFLGDKPSADATVAKSEPADTADKSVPFTREALIAKLAADMSAGAAAKTKAGSAGATEVSRETAKAETADAAAKLRADGTPTAPEAPKAGKSSPSEALLDAVVDMVHSEPSSLSVFASGSAFISGVGDHPEPAAVVDNKPKDPRKLDRAAAELLRPMLRQWLAENMPRIVEEALRSEFDGSQEADTDADKS
jgi:cell pole-organizing protein PopZ